MYFQCLISSEILSDRNKVKNSYGVKYSCKFKFGKKVIVFFSNCALKGQTWHTKIKIVHVALFLPRPINESLLGFTTLRHR